MSVLYHDDDEDAKVYGPQKVVWDRKTYSTFEDNLAALKGSKTVYVGNLTFYTTELQIEEVFSTVGPVRQIIMGLNSQTKMPCGFCFVEYYTHEHAAASLKVLNGTCCDDQIIRVDMDTGFKPTRQYGRGASGGQVGDDKRAARGMKHDPGRGGLEEPSNAGGGKRRRDKEIPERSIADLLSSSLTSSRMSKETSELLSALDAPLSTPREQPPPQEQPERAKPTAHVTVHNGMSAPPSRMVRLGADAEDDDEEATQAHKKRG